MLRRQVRITPAAERDIDDIAVYLATEADLEVALRFFDNAHSTFAKLLESPGMGRFRLTEDSQLHNIQQWSVSGFDNYLIFYAADRNGIDIVRVLHGMRDIDRFLRRIV